MKKLGSFFGRDLLLDTDDEILVGRAEKYLNDKLNHKCETVESEMARKFPKRKLPVSVQLLNFFFGKPTPPKAPRGKDASPLYDL